MSTEQIIISPAKGKQTLACNTEVDFMIYGGARASGKTYLLNLLPLKYIDDPRFQGIFFRRQYGELTGAGGLWDNANKLYPQFGAKANISDLRYTFPSGATLTFQHMFTEDHKERHRGLQYSFIAFDEIDHFSLSQITFLMTCLRSEAKMNSFVVGCCNPNPDSWVYNVVSWYLDERGFPDESKCGKIRYFVVKDGDFIWGDSEEFFKENYPECVLVNNPITGEQLYIPPKTFTFINGNIFDNEAVMKANPRYISELQNLPEHERDRQLWGNWHARQTGSNYFQREWLVEVDSFPVKARCCRAWDKASTEPSETNRNPDYTACSPRIYMHEGLYYLVWDVSHELYDSRDNSKVAEHNRINGRFRLRAGERDLKMLRQAHWDGHECHIVLPEDPSAAGKVEFEHSAKYFISEGFIVKRDPMPSNKSKLTRFNPFAAACQLGLVRIVRSSFPNEATYNAYMKELESFTGESSRAGKRHDDWADATASAFNYISKMKTIRDFTLPDPSSQLNTKTMIHQLKNTLG